MKRKLTCMLMLGCLFVGIAFGQQRAIRGQVRSQEDGAPLAGVSVTAQGTAVAVTTNEDGQYSINVDESVRALVFRYVGFQEQTVAVGSSNMINVTLQSDMSELEEVVVVAYGTQRSTTFTGSATTVGADQLEQRPITNAIDALAGAAPGVQTSSGSGQPGTAASIRVRGLGSINASNDPLYVVDGIPYSGTIESINAADIETVTVLKDASTAAMYGSRGANGVIMITTKKGKQGKTRLNVRALQGISNRGIPEYDRVDAYRYYPLMWEAYRNSLAYRGSNPLSLEEANKKASEDIFGLLAYNPFTVPNDAIVNENGVLNPAAQLKYNDLDWADPLTRTGQRGDYSMSVSGANDNTDYFFSLGYTDEEGFTKQSDFNRITGRLNMNSQIRPWFKTGLNVSGSTSKSNRANDGSSTGYANPFYFSRNMGPIYPVYAHDPATGEFLRDLNGDLIYDLGGLRELGLANRPAGASNGRHVVAETLYNLDRRNRNALAGRAYAEVKFLKDFTFQTSVGLDIANQQNEGYDNNIVGDGAPAGRARRTNYIYNSYNFNQILTYDRSFGKSHVNALLGHENYDYKYDYNYGFKQGIISEGNYELINFTTINSLTSYKRDYRLESYMARVNYDYDEKYLLSASWRTDGSSRFSPDSRWGTFWSFGAGWNLDREDFLQGVSWINALKLRSSYGQLGNDALLDEDSNPLYYGYQSLYSIGINNAADPGFIQYQLSSDLVWESNTSFDVGVEFALFGSRLNGTVEYFHRKSDNLLFSVPLPITSGLLERWENVGSMYNEGIEFDINGDLVRNDAFRWNLRLNGTTFSNRITALPRGEIIDGTKRMTAGSGVYDFWLRDWHGVDPNTGAGTFVADNVDAAGVYELDGVMVTTDHNNAKFDYHGSAIPDLYGGITNEFRYKGFNLSVLLTYQLGGKVYDASYATLMNTGNYGAAWHADIENRWQQPGDVTDVPRVDVTSGFRSSAGAQSSRFLIDGSYLAFRNVTLGYTIPQSLLSKLTLTGATVYVSGENLAFFSKRKGMFVGQSFTGVTSNAYQPARLLTLGVNFNL